MNSEFTSKNTEEAITCKGGEGANADGSLYSIQDDDYKKKKGHHFELKGE